METVKTLYVGDLRTRAHHTFSGNEIITDAPPDNKGRGEAFSPTDLLATSLGSCILTIMGIAAREHGFSIDNTKIRIYKIMASNPRRVGEVKIEFFFPDVVYSEKEKKILAYASKTCPVALSLSSELKQTIHFYYHGENEPVIIS